MLFPILLPDRVLLADGSAGCVSAVLHRGRPGRMWGDFRISYHSQTLC